MMSGGRYVFCSENTIFDIAKDFIIVTEPKSKVSFDHVFKMYSILYTTQYSKCFVQHL